MHSWHTITDLQIQASPHRFRKTSAIPKFKKKHYPHSQNNRKVTANGILKVRSLKFKNFKFTQKCYNPKEPN